MRFKRVCTVMLSVILTTALSSCAQKPVAPDSLGSITVGSKEFVESEILAELIAERLTARGFTVDTRRAIGGTQELRQGLVDGSIDIYPEYTGTALAGLPGGRPSVVASEVLTDPYLSFHTVSLIDRRDFDMVWLNPAPGNNTFIIAIPRSMATSEGISTISEFAEYVRRGGRVKLVASKQSLARSDSLKRFEDIYGFRLHAGQIESMAAIESLLAEQAAGQGAGGVNAALGYSTDAGIEPNDLVALVDDKHAQIVYQPAPVLMAKTQERYPEIAEALAPVFAKLTTETLRELNAAVVLEGQEPSTVARKWLAANGFGE